MARHCGVELGLQSGERFAALPRGSWDGIVELQATVLLDALGCMARRRGASAHEAWLWFHSEAATHPFTFERVCEGLGLDSSAVRDAIRRSGPAAVHRTVQRLNVVREVPIGA